MDKFYQFKCHNLTSSSLVMLLISVMLSGCVNGRPFQFSSNGQSPDYASYSCQTVLQLKDEKTYNNALYWLQVMPCVKQFSNIEVQSQLAEISDSDWASLYKRSILLAHINSSESEQRQILDKLQQSKQGPTGAVQNLMGLWIKNQQIQLALTNEKNKYRRFKENSDNQLHSLEQELKETQIKLKSLTEIEKQLPTRNATKAGGVDSLLTRNDTESQTTVETTQSTEHVSESPQQQE